MKGLLRQLRRQFLGQRQETGERTCGGEKPFADRSRTVRNRTAGGRRNVYVLFSNMTLRNVLRSPTMPGGRVPQLCAGCCSADVCLSRQRCSADVCLSRQRCSADVCLGRQRCWADVRLGRQHWPADSHSTIKQCYTTVLDVRVLD